MGREEVMNGGVARGLELSAACVRKVAGVGVMGRTGAARRCYSWPSVNWRAGEQSRGGRNRQQWKE